MGKFSHLRDILIVLGVVLDFFSEKLAWHFSTLTPEFFCYFRFVRISFLCLALSLSQTPFLMLTSSLSLLHKRFFIETNTQAAVNSFTLTHTLLSLTIFLRLTYTHWLSHSNSHYFNANLSLPLSHTHTPPIPRCFLCPKHFLLLILLLLLLLLPLLHF